MPPDRYSSKDAFNIDVLDPWALSAPDGLTGRLLSGTFQTLAHQGKTISGGVYPPSPTTKEAITEPDQSRYPAFPMVQPMKAALYFEDVEGLGEWSILLSTRAQKDLQGIKDSDTAMFKIVVEKIKWDLTLHRNDSC